MTRVLGVVSGKGGVGKTTVASNISLALKKLGKKVIVVDCNLSTPHLSYYLGVSNYKHTLNDALLGKVDIISAVNNCDGIKYVPASLDLKDLIGLDPVHLKSQLKKLVDSNVDFIILDSAPGLGREAISVLSVADEIIFVTSPFVPMVNDVTRCVNVLKELKGVKSLGIILNMVTNGKHEILNKTISDITGVPVIGEVPFDKDILYSLVSKTPFIEYKPNSLASESIRHLAAYLIGESIKSSTKAKIHKLFTKLKNTLLPSKIVMPESVKEVKEEIFIQ